MKPEGFRVTCLPHGVLLRGCQPATKELKGRCLDVQKSNAKLGRKLLRSTKACLYLIIVVNNNTQSSCLYDYTWSH
jgi:hypothetical protein